jgi:DNA repair protein RecN (Recombination protein N)
LITSLKIKNYAIIKEVEIEFGPKLNIITGETGAGKSIMMGALGLILGERADAKSLMNQDDKCVIECSFDIKKDKLKSFFKQNELDYDDLCIVRREITNSGKSRAFINDTPVTLNLLKDLGSRLVDIVSQHETLELNEAEFQLEIIDAIADNLELLEDYKNTFNQYKNCVKQLEELNEREAKAKQDEDYYKFILNELSEAKIQETEQEELENALNVLSHAETIQEAAYNAYTLLDGTENSLIDQLRVIKSGLSSSQKHHKGIEELSIRIEQSTIELKDIAAEFDNISNLSQANPTELARVDNRLQLLFNLQKKHRLNSNIELLEFQRKLENDILAISSLSKEIEQKELELKNHHESVLTKAKVLSEKRKNCIPEIEKNISKLLAQVAMPDAELKVKHTSLDNDKINQTGTDMIEFYFAANKGSQMQAINKVASGGELSRLMLCIKSLISDKISLPSIVFDEIDTGISGEAALKVGNVMKEHAKKHQVLAITHLPQIAAKADNHFNVYKTIDDNTTRTNIRKLNEIERQNEIAVMLAGNKPSDQVLLTAKEMMGA